ncbi:uncharacterized protein LOC133181731 [Saccostrea echinata]|uniref:uncharacterized protein LOC133181731 n=1 Tax=Saccostrea echinata TaxID=191078 RepID=UPI002A81E366|nr:uncharacterized protein LOC133181731 [Saccostrea echinata]
MWYLFIVFVLFCFPFNYFCQNTTRESGRTTDGVKEVCNGNGNTTEVNLVEGESSRLRCDVTLNYTSNPDIRWFASNNNKENTFLHITGEILKISNISRSCVPRTYRCESFISGRSVCNQTFETVVLGPPLVYIYMEKENNMDKTKIYKDHLEIALDKSSAKRGIICSVDSYPLSNIKWYEPSRHDRGDMDMGYLLSNKETAMKNQTFGGTIDGYRFEFTENIKFPNNILPTRELVMNIQVGDTQDYNRTYTCYAENEYGYDKWDIRIVEDTI